MILFSFPLPLSLSLSVCLFPFSASHSFVHSIQTGFSLPRVAMSSFEPQKGSRRILINDIGLCYVQLIRHIMMIIWRKHFSETHSRKKMRIFVYYVVRDLCRIWKYAYTQGKRQRLEIIISTISWHSVFPQCLVYASSSKLRGSGVPPYIEGHSDESDE